MTNLNFIYSELTLAFSIMLLLIIGVFKKKSSSLIYNLSILTLLIIFILSLSLFGKNSTSLFINSYKIDYLSTFMKGLLYLSGIFVMLSSTRYLILFQIFKIEYPILLLSSILGMSIMISSNDLIVFYMGLELQSLALYVLASFKRENPLSAESGLKYFVLSALSSGLLLYGCSLIYGYAGSTNFDIISSNINSVNYGLTLGIVFILVGLAFKISAVPFHMWAPDVYQGSPTSVTIFFAILPKIAALTVFIRFLYIPFINLIDQWQVIIIFLSIASMIFGAVAAIGQKNLKRLMAYSSISHMGFALAGLAVGTNEGIQSSITYMSLYVIMNLSFFSSLFMLKINQEYYETIDDLSGLSKNHPMLSLAMLVSLFSLAGIPPLAGFFAKFYIFMAVIEQEMYFLAIVGLLSTVVAAFYYLRIIKTIYFDEEKQKYDKDHNLGLKLSLILSTLIIATYFIYPSGLISIISKIIII
ncbi:NADH-quinone oxidoreductase subunit NuoN [Candidatus Pelagibacter sp.]|nr:NADH-quinone oxidoreductase subunit NuoN [Candidatus Pelagibacter sp.]